jgi:hypothetical protein
MKVFGKTHPLMSSGITKYYLNLHPVVYIQHINLFGGGVRVIMLGGRLMIDLYVKSHTHCGGDGNEIRNEDITQEHIVITWQSGIDSPQHTFRM